MIVIFDGLILRKVILFRKVADYYNLFYKQNKTHTLTMRFGFYAAAAIAALAADIQAVK